MSFVGSLISNRAGRNAVVVIAVVLWIGAGSAGDGAQRGGRPPARPAGKGASEVFRGVEGRARGQSVDSEARLKDLIRSDGDVMSSHSFTPEEQFAASQYKSSLERFNSLVGPTGINPSPDVVMNQGRRWYSASRFDDAALAFELELNRLVLLYVAAGGSVLRSLDVYANSPVRDAVPRERLGSTTAVYKPRDPIMSRDWYEALVETNRSLRRTKARSAAAAMGPGVIVVERLLGGAPDDASAQTSAQIFIDGPKTLRLGPRREHVFHLSDWDGKIDFEIGVATEEELVAKIGSLASSTASSFSGTVVIAQNAVRSKMDVSRAFPKAFVVHDPGLAEAVNGMRIVRQPRAAKEKTSIALLLPSDERQQILMGLESWSESDRVLVWRHANDWARRVRSGAVITWRSNALVPPLWVRRLWDTQKDREALLKALAESRDVLVLFAHGSRDWLALPDGSMVSAKEIAGLKLTNSPVVLLLSCEGAKPASTADVTQSFAQALKSAGAAAVYAAEEKLDVRVALSIADRFVQGKRELSTLDVIRRIDEEQRRIKAPRMRLKVELLGIPRLAPGHSRVGPAENEKTSPRNT